VHKTQHLRVVVAGAAALVLAACGDAADTVDQAGEAPLVEVIAAAPASAAGSIRASGLVGYRREPVLSFATPGVVGTISVDSGDIVRRGQRLATLRRTSVGSNVDEAALARANAERDLARTQELFERGFVSEARLDEARLAVERARDSAVLTAPTDGVILRRSAEPAQSVAAGATILVLGETGSGVVVRAPVNAGDTTRIRIGDSVTVRLSELNGATLQGRVARVGAKGDDATGAFEVEVEVAEPAGLRSGMVAEVEIAAAPRAGLVEALIAPTLALLDARADQGVVFVVDENNIAHRRTVRTAGVTEAGVLIVEGLQPGERIISKGAAYVRDGEAVRVAAGS